MRRYILHFIGFYDYTVWLTYISFLSAVGGVVSASKGNTALAVLCLLISGFCDMFDGIVARTKKNRSDDQKNFGIQIDSLSDLVAFGILPAMIYRSLGVVGALGTAILAVYALCGLIRLAYFNILEIRRQSDPAEQACAHEFRGMPITASAVLTPLIFLVGKLLPASVSIWVYFIAPAVMAFLFVLDIGIPKPDIGAMLSGNKKR